MADEEFKIDADPKRMTGQADDVNFDVDDEDDEDDEEDEDEDE